MVAQAACLDQSSQDMEHSCGNDESSSLHPDKMCVPQTERLVGFIGCLACIRLSGSMHTLHTQVTDASEWGVAYIPAR